MGSGRFDPDDYATYTSSTVGKTTDEVYTSRNLHDDLNPMNVKIRESRDSGDNPNSTPIIVALDVTGSMGMIADNIAREGLGVLFNNILDRKPIPDPHIMFMGVGDVHYDRAPLQVSQFEADGRIIEQLTNLWLEHGGGGNLSESYHLPWFFAGFHTEHDSMIKRGKKGYLFTIGDEEVPDVLTKDQIKKVTGDTTQSEMTAKELLEIAERSYNVFHIMIEEGDHMRRRHKEVVESWTALMGQRAIKLADHEMLAQTIVSIIEINEGFDAEESVKRWGSGASIVKDATKNLPKGKNPPMLGGPSA